MQELLDLVQHRLAFLPVRLARLLPEERLDILIGAARERTLDRHELGHACGRVAVGRVDADADPFQLLLQPRRLERRALHRDDPGLDADGPEIGADRLPHRVVGRIRIQIAGVEAVGVARLGQQLLGLRRIVGIGLERERELELARHHAAGETGRAEVLGVVDRFAVDRVVGGQSHAPVVPR